MTKTKVENEKSSKFKLDAFEKIPRLRRRMGDIFRAMIIPILVLTFLSIFYGVFDTVLRNVSNINSKARTALETLRAVFDVGIRLTPLLVALSIATTFGGNRTLAAMLTIVGWVMFTATQGAFINEDGGYFELVLKPSKIYLPTTAPAIKTLQIASTKFFYVQPNLIVGFLIGYCNALIVSKLSKNINKIGLTMIVALLAISLLNIAMGIIHVCVIMPLASVITNNTSIITGNKLANAKANNLLGVMLITLCFPLGLSNMMGDFYASATFNYWKVLLTLFILPAFGFIVILAAQKRKKAFPLTIFIFAIFASTLLGQYEPLFVTMLFLSPALFLMLGVVVTSLASWIIVLLGAGIDPTILGSGDAITFTKELTIPFFKKVSGYEKAYVVLVAGIVASVIALVVSGVYIKYGRVCVLGKGNVTERMMGYEYIAPHNYVVFSKEEAKAAFTQEFLVHPENLRDVSSEQTMVTTQPEGSQYITAERLYEEDVTNYDGYSPDEMLERNVRTRTITIPAQQRSSIEYVEEVVPPVVSTAPVMVYENEEPVEEASTSTRVIYNPSLHDEENQSTIRPDSYYKEYEVVDESEEVEIAEPDEDNQYEEEFDEEGYSPDDPDEVFGDDEEEEIENDFEPEEVVMVEPNESSKEGLYELEEDTDSTHTFDDLVMNIAPVTTEAKASNVANDDLYEETTEIAPSVVKSLDIQEASLQANPTVSEPKQLSFVSQIRNFMILSPLVGEIVNSTPTSIDVLSASGKFIMPNDSEVEYISKERDVFVINMYGVKFEINLNTDFSKPHKQRLHNRTYVNVGKQLYKGDFLLDVNKKWYSEVGDQMVITMKVISGNYTVYPIRHRSTRLEKWDGLFEVQLKKSVTAKSRVAYEVD